jgi:hypothetical protein
MSNRRREVKPDPIILLIGNADHEGIVSVLKTSSYIYTKKILESSPQNWESIVTILNTETVLASVVKLTPASYELLDREDYAEVGEELFTRLKATRNLVFAYEDLVNPDEAEGGGFGDSFHYPELGVRRRVNAKLASFGIETVCYKTNAELTVIGSQFIRDVLGNLLFRLYVPHGRLYGAEIDKLLQLFKDYLSQTGRVGVSLNRVAAEQGTSYEFCGDHEKNSELSSDFADFSRFLDLCISDIEKAREVLEGKAVRASQISGILAKYAKEARRLHVDIRQDREMRVLSIRHRLESELVDVLPQSIGNEWIAQMVNAAVPEADSLTRITLGSSTPLLPSRVDNLTINVRSQVIGHVQGVVGSEVSGDIHVGPEGKELLKILDEYGGSKKQSLISSMHEAADAGLGESVRLTRRQQLKSFLYGLAPDVARAGIHLLEAYLQKGITGQ